MAYGLRHYVEIGAQPRNFSKVEGEYHPRYKAACGAWVTVGEGSYEFTELTCDDCLEFILQMVLNNLVMVESGHYEAIEAGWSFVRARAAREKSESTISRQPKKKTRKKSVKAR